MAAPVMPVDRDETRDVKTAVHIDDILPGAEGSIHICGEGTRHPICVIQNGLKYVYIYENAIRKLTLQGVLHLPSSCQCMCVARDAQGGEHLIFCLKDGRVIQKNAQCFNKETRAKKKKKKKDKHKVKDKLMEGAADPLPRGGGDCPPSNQEIFGDLLSGTRPSSSAAQPSDIIQDEFGAKVVVLGDDHVMFNEPKVQDVMFVDGCLITCAESKSGWTLSVYRQHVTGQHVKGQHVKGQSQSNGTTSASLDASTKQLEFDKSAAFKTILPGRQISLKSQSDGSFFNSRRPFLHIKEESNLLEKPQLFCVISQSMLKERETTFATFGKTLTVEDSLYNTLFGADNNLSNTPTLLISLPDGCIYQSPLTPKRSTQSEPQRTISNWFCLRTSVFFVLDQPAAFIHGFRTVRKQGDSTSSCVCILGQCGRVVRISENDDVHLQEKLVFTESFVRGPVHTACVTRTHQGIMYSTGKEIYGLSLSNSKKSGSPTMKDNVSCSSRLGVAEIRALAELGTPKAGSSQLVALTVSGSILKLNLPTVGSHGNTIQPITAAAAGKRIQESLQAIDNISTRSRELATLSETQDHVLCEISKACHLANMLLGEWKLSGSSRMFSLDTKCGFRNNGMLCHLELSCKVTNHSQWSLSHGWSLTVTMETASECRTKVAEGAKYNVTKSVQLVDFQPMETVEVSLPLLNGKVSLSLPVNIQSCLHFSPKAYLSSLLPGKNVIAESDTNFVQGEIYLPVNKPRVIDMMTVLRPVQEDAAVVRGNTALTRQCQTTYNSGSDWLASALQDAANRRHSTSQTAPSSGDTNDKSVGVCVTLGSDVTTKIFEKHKNDGCSRQEQVLKWLLEDNAFTTQSTNPLSLRTPGGKVVSFEVKGQQRRQSAAGGGSEIRGAVEVVVTAPDYPTLTQLQLAVNQRIKMVLETEGSQVSITTTPERLQKELGKVQDLQKKLQSLEDFVIQEQLSSTQCHTNAQLTLELYQQLRTRLPFM